MTTTAKKDNELYITRIYDAPVKAVWDAWTDPKQAAKWWGPRGFTITTHSSEAKTVIERAGFPTRFSHQQPATRASITRHVTSPPSLR